MINKNRRAPTAYTIVNVYVGLPLLSAPFAYKEAGYARTHAQARVRARMHARTHAGL